MDQQILKQISKKLRKTHSFRVQRVAVGKQHDKSETARFSAHVSEVLKGLSKDMNGMLPASPSLAITSRPWEAWARSTSMKSMSGKWIALPRKNLYQSVELARANRRIDTRSRASLLSCTNFLYR